MKKPLSLFILVLLGCEPDKSEPHSSDQDTATSSSDTGARDDAGDTGDTGEAGDEDTGAFADWSELDGEIMAQMEAGWIPGLGVAVIARGEVVLARGYGWADVEAEVPVTAQTPFMLASISKTVTGTALMQAVEAGHLSLDQPISELLPFAVDNPHTEGEVITVRHLMTHTSGIRDRWSAWGELGEADALYTYGDSDIALGTVLEGYLVPGGTWYHDNNYATDLPGEEYRYGNMATALAGHLLETTTGVPLDDHSDSHIFGPLGMDNTGWHLADHDPAAVAIPYSQTGGSYLAYGHYGYPDYPDGQLRASAQDMARYLLAYDLGGQLDGARILSAESIDEMFSLQVPDVEGTQGLFWFWSTEYGRHVIGHDGGDYGVSTMMLLDPEDGLGIVVLANTDWTGRSGNAMSTIGSMLFEAGREW